MSAIITLAPDARILLVRTDKLGDLILTTPALMSLRDAYPKAHIAFLCRSYAAPVLENNPAVNEILLSDAPGESFWRLAARIRAQRFDAAVHFYCEPRSVWLTAIAGIPARIGPLSKPSALLLNRRIRQNRSEARRHEAEYNLELAAACGASSQNRPPVIFLTEQEKKSGAERISDIVGAPSARTILIHPGSAGSAKNWPIERYMELAQKIAEFGNVLVTTGPGEGWIAKKAESLNNPRIRSFKGENDGVRTLAGIIQGSSLMISNSTGPLHMAVALSVPTCSFYPLEPAATSPKRWGPFGAPKTNIVLTPEHPRAGMSSISVDRALTAVKTLLELTSH